MSNQSSIRLTGAPNFRDIGGYATADGRVVKHGMLFRSGDSSGLTAEDIEKLKSLNVQLVVDLRSTRESAANEIRWPMGKDTEFIAANILADLRAGNKSVLEMLTSDPTSRGAANMMETTYRVLPHALGPTLLQIARRIVDGDKVPVIFHCTVGRDRAGITAAMLLHALGVPRDIVIADYLRTNIHINAKSIRDMTEAFVMNHETILDQEALDVLTFARIEHFHAAMRIVAVEYGTTDDYLRAIGISDAMQSQLRDRLLEPA